jgi:drug/metabolite transporter (DMT)-like permease
MWFVFGVAAMLTIGGSDFVAALAGRRTQIQSEILPVTWTQHTIATVTILFAVLLFDQGSASQTDLVWGVVTGLAIGIGKPLYFAGLSFGSITVLAPITTVLAIIVPVLFALAFDAYPGDLALIGIVLALPAVAVVSSRTPALRERWSTTLVLLIGCLCGVLFGLSAITIGEMTPNAGLLPLLASSSVIWLLLAAASLLTRAGLIASPSTRKPSLLSGGLEGVGVAFIALALQRGQVSVAATLLGVAPVISVILAWLILKERLDPKHKAALLLACIAIALMSTS